MYVPTSFGRPMSPRQAAKTAGDVMSQMLIVTPNKQYQSTESASASPLFTPN